MDNPWRDLPNSQPFVLTPDADEVKAFNVRADAKRRLDLSMLPQPFLGPRKANLVVLGRNPGRRGWRSGVYADALRRDIESTDGTPLPPLRSEFVTDEGKWWGKCFKAVLAETEQPSSWLADRVLAVEFHGYHSERYRNPKTIFPSQRYGFWLVEEAVRRKATVVIMRGRRDWVEAVPSLNDADPVVLNAPRSATISPKNCGLAEFQRVLAALE